MLRPITNCCQALLHMLYPHLCKGCATDLPKADQQLCASCLATLPFTGFESFSNNPAEKIFFGRSTVLAAMSLLYFTKDSLVQSIIHQIKYKDAKSLALYMGEMLGRAISRQQRFRDLDLIIPLPLTPGREKQRGYNQSALLAEGISSILKVPTDTMSLRRSVTRGTQTHQSREERWLQMQGQFFCPDPGQIKGLSILLVDDVITTGATLDACSSLLNGISGVRTSIAALAIALK